MRQRRGIIWRSMVSCAALAMLLSGCTAALSPLEPAAPDDSSAKAASPAKAGEGSAAAVPPLGPNPYEAGALRSWSVKMPSAPSFVQYSQSTHTLVAAFDGIGSLRGAQLASYSVVGDTKVLDEWSVDIADAKSITALAVASQTIYVNTLSAAGAADLLAIDARTGQERMRWSNLNHLDSDVPQIVGAYGENVGVTKRASTRLTAALLSPAGAVVDSREFVRDGDAEAAQESAEVLGGQSVVNTGALARLDSGDSGVQFNEDGAVFVAFPSLNTLEASECYSASDGFVCVALGTMESDNAASAAQKKEQDSAVANQESVQASDLAVRAAVVTEYDAAGHSVRETVVGPESLAANVTPLGMLASASTRELGDALAAAYVEASGDERVPAIVYGEQVALHSQWVAPESQKLDGARALLGQAPFYQLPSGTIANAFSGTALTAAGAIGYVDTDAAHAHIFEYADGVLYYLKPVGK